MELVNFHLQLGSDSGTSVDERPAPRDVPHMDRYAGPWEDTEGHPVDPLVDEGLNKQHAAKCTGLRSGELTYLAGRCLAAGPPGRLISPAAR